MPSPTPILLFSDVDGTLIDANYQCPVSSHILKATATRIKLIFVSSRTIEELLHLNQQLQLKGDCIGENGGLIATRDPLLSLFWENQQQLVHAGQTVTLHPLAAPAVRVKEKLQLLADKYQLHLRFFDELSEEELAIQSGYDLAAARRARMRRHSVLIVPPPQEEMPERIWEKLREEGLEVSFGGKWYSVLHGSNKGKAIKSYLAGYQQCYHGNVHTVGIGNQDNDASLLEAVDRRFVIRNPVQGYAPALKKISNVTLLQEEGPAGWTEMLENLFAD